MNQQDLEELQAIRGYPALSILLPTHRKDPEKRQDPIRVKNLVREATDRLLAEFPRREVSPLLARLNYLVAQIDYRYTLDGLALFVNEDHAFKFQLPFRLKERVVVDETFATRDLVFVLNRSQRYWVLVLSEQPTRLYEGCRETLVEMTNDGFPMTYNGPGVDLSMPGGHGVNKSAYRDDRHRLFFRRVDAAFGRIATVNPLPLALVGTDRDLAFFDEVSANRNLLFTRLTGSHDKTPTRQLAKLVWPLVRAGLAKQRQEVLKELEVALGAQRAASGIGEAWPMAKEGRGATLLVEEDFYYPARLDASGLRLVPADDPSAPGVIDDAVDELIEMVMSKGGQAVFVDKGTLEVHQHVAMILRY